MVARRQTFPFMLPEGLPVLLKTLYLWTSKHRKSLHRWRKSKTKVVSFPLAQIHTSNSSSAKDYGYMMIISGLELHCSAKHGQSRSHIWLSCLRIWLWWRLPNYHVTHNWWENKIPLLETLTTGSFPLPALLEEPLANLCCALEQGEDDVRPCSLIPFSTGRGGTHRGVVGRCTQTGGTGKKTV